MRYGRDLEIVLRKALEKNSKDRYGSATAFADDLENVLKFRPIAAMPPTFVSRLAKWARRQPYHAGLAAVLIAGVPMVSILTVRSVRQQWRLERIEDERRLKEARRLSQNGKESEAAAIFTDLLRANPDDPELLRLHSLSYNVLWKAEKDEGRRLELQNLALADISRAVELQPEAAWPYRVRAFILKEMGRQQEAEADEQAARRHASAQPTASDLVIDGILALQGEDNAGAVRLLSEAIRLRPDSTDAHLYRAEALERLGETSKAIKDLEISSALEPSDAYARHSLGKLLTESGSLEEGEALLHEALERKPDDAEIHETLADNLLKQGRVKVGQADSGDAHDLFRRAEESARKALALDPNLPWAHVNLGASLMESNKLLESSDAALVRQAVGEFEKVIARHEIGEQGARAGAYSAALMNQCDALIQSQDLQRALSVCRAVADRVPDNANSHYNLAGVYALLGRPEDALASLRKDLELGDTDDQYLASDKWFASLHGDPRFGALLEKMKHAAK